MRLPGKKKFACNKDSIVLQFPVNNTMICGEVILRVVAALLTIVIRSLVVAENKLVPFYFFMKEIIIPR